MMKYKGYVAVPQYSANDKCFFGKLAGIKDHVIFEGNSVQQLEKAFREAVNDYIETCSIMGKKPQQSQASKLQLRLHPELHAKIIETAGYEGKSVNQYLIDMLEHSVC